MHRLDAASVDAARQGDTAGHGTPVTRLGHVPALDGLRAIALLAVLAFHHGYPAARGGYLGVSAFFTLSGFLIASLSLAEWTASGRLSPARFWERRARRLLPAALVTLAVVLVLYATGLVGGAGGFRGDLLAALGYAANWRFAATGDDYATLFGAPSPVLHFWSLAIEEQFYLLFPMAFAAVMAPLGRRWRLGALVFGALAAASFALAWWTAGRHGNAGIAYYGTHTRAGELLVGVALAYLVTCPGVVRLLARRAVALGLRWGALGALAGLAWLWHAQELEGARLFRGATVANSLLTAWVILAVLRRGPAGTLLATLPLRALGKVSYGAYLLHWPIYLVLDAERVGLGHHALFVLRVAVTLLAAWASYRLVEAPFRFRLPMPRRRLAGLAAAGAGLLVVAGFAAPASPGDEGIDLTGGPDEATVDQVNEGVGADSTRVFIAGDSMAWSLLSGLRSWNDEQPDDTVSVQSHVAFACPVTGPGEAQLFDPFVTADSCRRWHEDLDDRLGDPGIDVAVMFTGMSDLMGRPIEGAWRDFGDPVFEQHLARSIDAKADQLARRGVPVLWLGLPHVRGTTVAHVGTPWQEWELNDPARVERFNEILHEQLDGRPGFRVVDTIDWMHTWPGGEFEEGLRDGVHLTEPGSERAARWLVPQLADAVRHD